MTVALAALIEQAVHSGPGAPEWTRIEQDLLASHGLGRADALIPGLQRMVEAWPQSAQAHWLLGVALHDTQKHEEALAAMAQAALLAPRPEILLGHAQLCHETGRAAAARFAALCARTPDDPRLVSKLAASLAAESQPQAAEQVLVAALERHPAWLDGQRQLASLRQTGGKPDFDRAYAEAVRRVPDHAGLRLGWFTELAKARQWASARRVIQDARHTLGELPALQIASAYLDAESGAADHDPALFDNFGASLDPGLGLARVRHALRCGDAEKAARHAEAFLPTAAATAFWPYLSIAWRLLGDARAEWLDRPDQFIRVASLGLGSGQLAELAVLLRSLHTMAEPYLEQSVRGGTQTDRPLLFRHEQPIVRLRQAILEAVAEYVAALPPPDPRHPLLAPQRQSLRFAGSWSVRLRDQGFHSCHTHPMGWISSACYIALPPAPGEPPAGWLRLGTPPPELRLDLAPYREIAPQPGQLVLFPATMWHGTVPFKGEERLTVAFDMRPM